jgi:hypothetical protein
MATKVTGLSQTTMTVTDLVPTARDIRNAITDWKVTTPRAVQDVTGLDKAAKETLLVLADLTITINGVFDTSANGAHAVFSTVPSSSTARAVNIVTNGKTLGFNANFTDYAINRANTGELTWSSPGVLADGAAPTWS